MTRNTPNESLSCFVSAGCVNRRHFANMSTIITLSGDNMSVLYFEFVALLLWPKKKSMSAALIIV